MIATDSTVRPGTPITLRRNFYLQTGIFGTFSQTINGSFVAATLEHAYPDVMRGWIPKIPGGGITYRCIRRKSPHFGYDVFMLIGVPGHDFIEVHIGNYNRDSDGCILLGAMADSKYTMITHSQNQFDSFMALQSGAQEFPLLVV